MAFQPICYHTFQDHQLWIQVFFIYLNLFILSYLLFTCFPFLFPLVPNSAFHSRCSFTFIYSLLLFYSQSSFTFHLFTAPIFSLCYFTFHLFTAHWCIHQPVFSTALPQWGNPGTGN